MKNLMLAAILLFSTHALADIQCELNADFTANEDGTVLSRCSFTNNNGCDLNYKDVHISVYGTVNGTGKGTFISMADGHGDVNSGYNDVVKFSSNEEAGAYSVECVAK